MYGKKLLSSIYFGRPKTALILPKEWSSKALGKIDSVSKGRQAKCCYLSFIWASTKRYHAHLELVFLIQTVLSRTSFKGIPRNFCLSEPNCSQMITKIRHYRHSRQGNHTNSSYFYNTWSWSMVSCEVLDKVRKIEMESRQDFTTIFFVITPLGIVSWFLPYFKHWPVQKLLLTLSLLYPIFVAFPNSLGTSIWISHVSFTIWYVVFSKYWQSNNSTPICPQSIAFTTEEVKSVFSILERS